MPARFVISLAVAVSVSLPISFMLPLAVSLGHGAPELVAAGLFLDAYLTNPDDAKRLEDPEFRTVVADALAANALAGQIVRMPAANSGWERLLSLAGR